MKTTFLNVFTWENFFKKLSFRLTKAYGDQITDMTSGFNSCLQILSRSGSYKLQVRCTFSITLNIITITSNYCGKYYEIS